MRRRNLIAIVVAAVGLGIALGYLYRRWKEPTLEERAHDAAEDLRRGFEKILK